MKHITKRLFLVAGVVLVVGCSNGSDSLDTDENGSGNGPGNGIVDVVCEGSAGDISALSTIASQGLESDPIQLDVSSLQATLSNLPNGCAQSESLPVVQGDSVADILQRLNAPG